MPSRGGPRPGLTVYLPRPYPDEMLGSLLIRASHHLGLTSVQLAHVIGVDAHALAHFVIPTGLPRIASLAATPTDKLLLEHTAFPYISLTWDTHAITEHRDQLLRSRPAEPSIWFRSNFPRRPNPAKLRRFCPECIQADIGTYGESYWHRSHALPGVFLCPQHGVRLLLAHVYLFGAISRSTNVLPYEVIGTHADWQADQRQLQTISLATASTLSLPPGAWQHWAAVYRGKLEASGYRDLCDQTVLRKIALDCQGTFGPKFLTSIGLPITFYDSWPSRLATGKALRLQSSFAHILFRVFLESL
ncbi:TniQ family protein [Paraburkholderia hospita]|uniref:TniQ family protein n=1 Tax=Paraburkholderia hospita TaxID=169430 RepID=UPI0009DAFF5A|nr:hypothetical protein CA602_48340 [Paraburkholderia hospita]